MAGHAEQILRHLRPNGENRLELPAAERSALHKWVQGLPPEPLISALTALVWCADQLHRAGQEAPAQDLLALFEASQDLLKAAMAQLPSAAARKMQGQVEQAAQQLNRLRRGPMSTAGALTPPQTRRFALSANPPEKKGE